MNKVKQVVEQEPVVVIVGAEIALIEAVLLALPLFGVAITPAQTTALMGVVVTLGTLGIVFARQQVTSMARPRTADGKDAVIVEVGHEPMKNTELFEKL